MKYLNSTWKLAFAMLFLAALTASAVLLQVRYYVVQNSNTEKIKTHFGDEFSGHDNVTQEAIFFYSENLMQIPEASSQKAMIGFHFPSDEPLSKNQMIITQALIALICLLIATKFQIETSVYEFFHKDGKGVIVFEDASAEITHYFTLYTGMIFKYVGIVCLFLSLFVFVF